MNSPAIINFNKNVISSDRLFYNLNYIIIVFIIMMLWHIPQGGVFEIIPFISVIGIQRFSIIITLFTCFHFIIKKKVNVTSFDESSYFYLFCIGILISFLLASNENTISLQLELNSQNNSLQIYSILKGFFLFLSIIVFFRDINLFQKFLKIFLNTAAFFCLLVLFGYADLFLELFGGTASSDVFESFKGIVVTRFTFPTLDNNTNGGILSGILILSIFYGVINKKKTYYIIFPLLFTMMVISGLGRANSLKLLISLLIFFGIYYRFYARKFGLILIIMILGFIILSYTNTGYILFERWQEIANNFIPILKGESRLYVMDNFTWRILAALSGLPITVVGWIFGNGGIQTGYVYDINSASHIEFSNWISQYGLLTFVPLAIFLIKNISYFLKIKIKDISKSGEVNNKLLLYQATGIAICFGLIIEALNSPLFIGLWFWLGIISILVLHSKHIVNSNLGTD
ncbi:MAG: hypothetical protein RDU14_06965 [Melioribacteraceae bacterium]|nr:hypothetical protein [Melioribacteraceae bacterium]